MNINQAEKFDTVKARVHEYAADCADAFGMSNGFVFGSDNQVSWADKVEGGLFPAATAYTATLNKWALEQVSDRLDAPARWMLDPKHCPDDLKVDLMNKLAAVREPERLLMRMKGDTLRAVLSDQYSKFDNVDLIDLVGEAISGLGTEAKVCRAEVGDDLKAYIILPQITFAPDPSAKGGSPHGDGGLHPAVYIRNSERGGGAAGLHGASYRQVCSNGMIAWDRSGNNTVVRHRFVSSTSMRFLIADALTSALKMSEELTLQFIAAQEIHIEQPRLRSLIDGWGDKYGLSVEAGTNWLAAVTAEASSYGRRDEPALFDLVNAATYTAQTRSDDERENMERLAADLLYTVSAQHQPRAQANLRER